MPGDFDWNDAGPLVVRETRDTAAYLNGDGDVVIRQRMTYGLEQEDPALVIPIQRVRALIERLEQLLVNVS